MWRILKSDLAYNGSITFLANIYCLIMLLAIWFGTSRSNRAPYIMLVLLTAVFFASYTGEEKRVEQKRERLQTLCPLPIWQIGLMKSVYPLVIWINMFVVYISIFLLLSLFKTLSTSPSLRLSWMSGLSPSQMLALNGWILITNSVYLIVHDLRVSSRGGKMVFFRIIQVLLSFAVLTPFLIITNFLGAFGDKTVLAGTLSRISFSSLGYIGFNLLGALLFVISVVVFSRRRSYAKS